MQTTLNLRYTGPGVDDGRMDVYQASANMIAFSEFVVAASKSVFGEQVNTTAQVAGFSRGSFTTQMMFEYVGPLASLFSGISPGQVFTVIKEAFEVWKHLKGEPPQKIEHSTNQTVMVTNNNGQIIQVKTETLNLVFNEKASEAVKQYVNDALQARGVDGVTIAAEGGEPIASANQSEARCFVPVLESIAEADATFKMALVIEGPVFKDGNKWRFGDGQNSFFANMEDKDFLARVDAGEPFAKGDLLTVDLNIKQDRAGMRLNTIRTIVKVHEHREGKRQPKQIPLVDDQ